MRVFQVPPFFAAILLSALCMGLIGALVVLPIACIQWTWNAFIVSFSQLPHINVWQACLLYLAVAAVLYLTGVVQIEIEATKAE
ncbi:MAG: hypothetical protein HY711_10030 [Candidatus Melainabacteria bacterium]|nr:hypothetical protein [Candidatus Melainabacteria bacterium]